MRLFFISTQKPPAEQIVIMMTATSKWLSGFRYRRGLKRLREGPVKKNALGFVRADKNLAMNQIMNTTNQKTLDV